MRGSGLSSELRRLVAERADGLCEYCLIHQDDTAFGCHVDHIISLKHGGLTHPDNLALACVFCNRAKGSDIGSVVAPVEADRFIRFFHPRRDTWADHFGLQADGVTIAALSEIGTVTARVLCLNFPERLLEREFLRAVGRYPTPAALGRMTAP